MIMLSGCVSVSSCLFEGMCPSRSLTPVHRELFHCRTCPRGHSPHREPAISATETSSALISVFRQSQPPLGICIDTHTYLSHTHRHMTHTHIPVTHTYLSHTHILFTHSCHTHTPLHTHKHVTDTQTPVSHTHVLHTHSCHIHKHTPVTHTNTNRCYTHTLLSHTHIPVA